MKDMNDEKTRIADVEQSNRDFLKRNDSAVPAENVVDNKTDGMMIDRTDPKKSDEITFDGKDKKIPDENKVTIPSEAISDLAKDTKGMTSEEKAAHEKEVADSQNKENK